MIAETKHKFWLGRERWTKNKSEGYVYTKKQYAQQALTKLSLVRFGMKISDKGGFFRAKVEDLCIEEYELKTHPKKRYSYSC